MSNSRKTDELSFLVEIREKILTENLTLLTRGTMFFQGAGILVTDDRDEEFISPDSKVVVVETEYAQELSWLIAQLRDGLKDTISECDKEEFYCGLAKAANDYLSRSSDRTGLLLAVLLDASLVVAGIRQLRCDRMRDEVLSCASGLSDLAERI